jgi:hypothetical protein
MVKIFFHGLLSTWQKTLEAQKPADLRLMSEKIWENTLRPISRSLNKQTTPREFCASVTGAFLRWEVVGILVTLVSLVAQSLKGLLLLYRLLLPALSEVALDTQLIMTTTCKLTMLRR